MLTTVNLSSFKKSLKTPYLENPTIFLVKAFRIRESLEWERLPLEVLIKLRTRSKVAKN